MVTRVNFVINTLYGDIGIRICVHCDTDYNEHGG